MSHDEVVARLDACNLTLALEVPSASADVS